VRALAETLKKKDIPCRSDVDATTLCSFRIGGTVALVIEPRCEGELLEALALCRVGGYPFEILGNGSNVLFEDGYLRLALIRVCALDACRVIKGGIRAGCGVPLPRLSRFAALRGLSGLQGFCGIPGTLGGALAMNAGAYGKQISELVKCVEVLDTCSFEIKTDFNFKKSAFYRNSGYNGENVLFLRAELALQESAPPHDLLAQMQLLKAERKAAQPLEFPSAGCVFQRPCKDVPIGKLLDELGCKGMRVGGAEVSQKHAAFILNMGGASAADVKKLMLEIQKKAEKERGVLLTSELRIISDKR